MTTPFPFVAGAVLNASDLNALGTWDESSWTSPLSNVTIGNGTETARYMRVGTGTEVGLVVFYYKLLFGSTTSVSGDVQIVYPIEALDSRQAASGASCFFEDSNSVDIFGGIFRVSQTNGRLSAYTSSGSFVARDTMDATTPFAWASGDTLTVVGYYQPS